MRAVTTHIVAFLLAAGVIASANAELPIYQVQNLGTLMPGGPDGFNGYSSANGLNEAGWVVGFSYTSNGDKHAFLHDGTSMRDLGTHLGWGSSEATAISDHGFVVGVSEAGLTRGFLHDGNTMWELYPLGGSNSSAHDINNQTVVVGGANTTGDVATHALAYLSYQSGGTRTDLGTLGGTNSVATAISDDGGIAGTSDIVGDGAKHAFLLFYGTWDLGTLGGTNSRAADVNLEGAVVGESDVAGDLANHAFLHEGPFIGRPMRDLGTLGGANSSALGINSIGQVVGESEIADGSMRAFIYQDGAMRNLNDQIDPGVGFVIWTAVAINDVGQIAGLAENLNAGQYRAVLLTPITLSFDKLWAAVVGLPVEKKLARPLAAAEDGYAAGDLASACAGLEQFAEKVIKAPQKKLTEIERDTLLDHAQAIAIAVGCP